MSFADEEYLKEKNRKKEQETQKKTVEETPIQIEYEKRTFFDGRVVMEVPWDCEEVTEEAIQFVFYGSNKPQYVIESESTKVAYGYNYTELEIADVDILRFGTFAAKVLEQSGPSVKIYKVKGEKRDNFYISKVEFSSKGYDGGIYNVMFYVSLEGKLLINFIILPSIDVKKVKEVVDHMLKSFEVIEEEK